ncbi:DUF1490 family protein [Mycobacterium sp.]|uniref:DUF1490 family protein n=1 Tax=Mycobacterium sp. TaxID=1785 RepID=UPI0031E00FB8
MVWQGLHGLAVKAVPTVLTGVVGAAAYQAVAKAPWRKATVTATAWGLRAARTAERKTTETAERARLAVADVLAEAVELLGEEISAPAGADAVLTATTEADGAGR